MEGPEANRLAVVSERGWEAWFLDLLTDGSTCTAASQVSGSSFAELDFQLPRS